MKLAADERRTLAAEIATLLVDTYAIGVFERHVMVTPGGDSERSEFHAKSESAIRETVAEAIQRCCEFGGIALRDSK